MELPFFSNLLSSARQRMGWVAVCMNSNGLYFSRVKHSTGKPCVISCAFYPLENSLPATLEKLRKDKRIAGFQLITLLEPGEYHMLLVEAPNVPPEEFKTAVRWRIKDSLSYHIDEATVDVLRIPASKKGGGERPLSLYAIAAPNDTIKKHIALFEKARLDLKVIDIPEMAQRNIAALFEEGEFGLALLSFDEHGGLLTITSGGELYLARHLDITTGQLQDSNENLRQQYIERVELELHRSLDYFGRQFSFIPVNRMLVSAPEHLNLIQQLASSIELPVEQLNLSRVLDISAAPELADSEYASHMLLALGASLRQERRAS